jgi:hypothetical protein
MTHYVPSSQDVRRYWRLMLTHPELRQQCRCPCHTDSRMWVHNPGSKCPAGCPGYIAPPPETWCGLLVRVARDVHLQQWDAPAHWAAELPEADDGGDGPHPESAILTALAAAEKEVET